MGVWNFSKGQTKKKKARHKIDANHRKEFGLKKDRGSEAHKTMSLIDSEIQQTSKGDGEKTSKQRATSTNLQLRINLLHYI